ncbi:hypothetical protein I350_08023 [Cryptococcus amylolentus CBS 6273]|uniref:Uncharacterized protein n=1 Tax=Cryptococcus amylolentus CBS 6273 TaxID=1296118 RepID=A0A1E3J869_9TREE|nr:hypothetical protein I350_08023 [Cryptococcus amylolentus CBS 6273]
MPNGLRSHFSTTASTRSIHIETPLRLRTPPMAMRETASILKRSYGRLSNTCPVGSLWQEAFTTSGYVSETPKRGYHRRSRCRHLLSLRISTTLAAVTPAYYVQGVSLMAIGGVVVLLVSAARLIPIGSSVIADGDDSAGELELKADMMTRVTQPETSTMTSSDGWEAPDD